jgi:uncharacterized protein YecE (DUF72 family)
VGISFWFYNSERGLFYKNDLKTSEKQENDKSGKQQGKLIS